MHPGRETTSLPRAYSERWSASRPQGTFPDRIRMRATQRAVLWYPVLPLCCTEERDSHCCTRTAGTGSPCNKRMSPPSTVPSIGHRKGVRCVQAPLSRPPSFWFSNFCAYEILDYLRGLRLDAWRLANCHASVLDRSDPEPIHGSAISQSTICRMTASQVSGRAIEVQYEASLHRALQRPWNAKRGHQVREAHCYCGTWT